MRTQCASTSCPHRSQSPCSHFATSTLRIPRYTSTSCLQLHNFDATTALLQLNACQSTSLLRCTSSPTTQQHLASTCPTTSMQLNATPSAAPEFHQKRLQITCSSLASHLNLHDPMPLYMPRKIRVQLRLVGGTTRTFTSLIHSHMVLTLTSLQQHRREHVTASMCQSVRLRVLVACECSQMVCQAFRELGHLAFSCDIECVRNYQHLDWHIPADATPYIQGKSQFVTQDGIYHNLRQWDLIICHPPCTYICRVSSVHMYIDGQINQERLAKQKQAVAFFNLCLNANAPYVAVENPLPMAMAGLPKPTTYIDPSWFGEKYTKETLLWLRNLPPLLPTITNPWAKEFVRASKGKWRSRTFPKVAKAMAEQWSFHILNDITQQYATA